MFYLPGSTPHSRNKVNLQTVVPYIRVSKKPVAKRFATVVANVAASSDSMQQKGARRRVESAHKSLAGIFTKATAAKWQLCQLLCGMQQQRGGLEVAKGEKYKLFFAENLFHVFPFSPSSMRC